MSVPVFISVHIVCSRPNAIFL